MADIPARCIILARISDARDEDTTGVDEQIKAMLQLASRLRWGVGPPTSHVVSENDTSAYKRRVITLPDGSTGLRTVRPKFRRALDMLKQGQADGLIAYDLDRAVRDPRDLEDLIDVIEGSTPRIPVESITGSLRLSNDADITMARVMVAVANKSSRDTGRRVAVARRRLALSGEYGGGRRRFGFETDGKTVRQSEAAAIRKAADAVLTGMSLRQVVADLRDGGVPTVTGSDWTTASLRNILLRPSNAGLADYRGEIVSRDTEWPPILADDRQEAEHRWRELVAALTDPDRRTSPGNEPKWLGSLIYRCGCDCDRCQTDGHGRTNVAVSGGRAYACTYTCRAHSHLRRTAGTGGLSGPLTGADDFVSRLLVARLSQRDATSLLAPPVSGPDVTGLRVELARLRQLLDDQARLHAREVITTSQLETGSRELQAKMRAVEEQLDIAGEHDPLVGIVGRPDAAQVWEGLSVAQRRQILRLLLDVTLLPARPGRRPGGGYFDADSIGVVWRVRAPRE